MYILICIVYVKLEIEAPLTQCDCACCLIILNGLLLICRIQGMQVEKIQSNLSFKTVLSFLSICFHDVKCCKLCAILKMCKRCINLCQNCF